MRAGLGKPVPLPQGLEKGVTLLRLLPRKCRTFDEAGRALVWVFFNFDRLEAEREVPAALRAVVLGLIRQASAMHRGRFKRGRPLFPLPLGDLHKVKSAAERAAFEDFCTPHFAGLTPLEVWTTLAVIGLNGGAGCGRAAAPGKRYGAAEACAGKP